MGLNKNLKPGQSIKIGKEIEVKLIGVYNSTANVLITAPIDYKIEDSDGGGPTDKNTRAAQGKRMQRLIKGMKR